MEETKNSVVESTAKKTTKRTKKKANKIPEGYIEITKNILLPFNKENDSHFIPEANPFENVNKIIEHTSIAINKKLPVLLSGETGTGKTSLIRYLANKTNNGYRRVNHNGGTSIDDIVGKILVNKEGTYWVDGVLTQAMRNGDWYVADEINASSAEILFIYHSLLDDDGYIVLPENGGEIIKPHPNFRFFATMNPSADYNGVKELNKALMSRFIVLKTDFPSPNTESKILSARTGIDEETALKMVKFAGEIRATHAKDKVQFVLSTRDLLMWSEMFNVYGKFMISAEITVLNKVGDDDKEVIKDLLSLHFKTLDDPKTAKTEEPKKEEPTTAESEPVAF